jgi:hypothetical protein
MPDRREARDLGLAVTRDLALEIAVRGPLGRLGHPLDRLGQAPDRAVPDQHHDEQGQKNDGRHESNVSRRDGFDLARGQGDPRESHRSVSGNPVGAVEVLDVGRCGGARALSAPGSQGLLDLGALEMVLHPRDAVAASRRIRHDGSGGIDQRDAHRETGRGILREDLEIFVELEGHEFREQRRLRTDPIDVVLAHGRAQQPHGSDGHEDASQKRGREHGDQELVANPQVSPRNR